MKENKRLITALIIILIVGIGACAFLSITQKTYTIDDFTNKSQDDVRQWVKSSNIPEDMVIYAYDYSDDIDKGNVISQSVSGGTKIGSNDHVTFRISNGKDPDKKVLIPDFKGKKLDEIKKWFTDEGLTKVTYNTEIHDDMEEGTFVSITPITGSAVGKDDAVTVVTSTKTPPAPTTITFPDFTDNTEAQIEQWGNENGIYIRVIPEYSADIATGYFISADVQAGTEIDPGSTVRVYIAS